MTQITDLSFSELKQSLNDRVLSSVEITSAFLDRIESLNPTLNAFITITRDEAMRSAKKADAIDKGTATPYTGLPIAHKDLFCTDGTLTSCGSNILSNFVAPYDAHVVGQCKTAGLVSLGQTQYG